MDMQQYLAACAQLEGAWECFPFGPLPVCYKAGPKSRIFAQVYPDKVTLRCTRLMGEVWRAQFPGAMRRGFHCPPVQAPYFITVYPDALPDALFADMLRHAHVCVLTGAK